MIVTINAQITITSGRLKASENPNVIARVTTSGCLHEGQVKAN